MDGYWANHAWPDNDDANRFSLVRLCTFAVWQHLNYLELRKLRYAGGFSFESAEAC